MKIAVYGLGRFGRFWAELLMDLGFNVCGYNRSSRDSGTRIPRVALEEACASDVLFICSSISSIPQVAGEIAPLLRHDTLVVDTCSVKLYPLRELSRVLPDSQPILGTHPMFGPDSAGSGIQGLPLVISPWTAPESSLEFWSQQFSRAGMEVISMSADEHDHEAARTQGITHFIGRFLASLELKPSRISTLGFRKIFEVMEQTCNDPWQLFIDLQKYNPYTGEIRGEMTRHFEQMIQLLDGQQMDSHQKQ